ncbi:hypothetical protein JTE90_022499 [Oedothorax gibbosus]|uniref:Uncharacterized protein n=1 Tax=Oedothorax gibbosus TaxID=931172 RepID=A0AAV6UZ67_9ARAC|nr:hypothetical protein JTE90_022499 [Oedothorax gibbosus]
MKVGRAYGPAYAARILFHSNTNRPSNPEKNAFPCEWTATCPHRIRGTCVTEVPPSSLWKRENKPEGGQSGVKMKTKPEKTRHFNQVEVSQRLLEIEKGGEGGL